MTEQTFNESPITDRWVEAQPEPVKITPHDIIDTVCKYYKLTREAIFLKVRKGEIVKARQIACFLIKEKLGMSFKVISKLFFYCKSPNGHDHTTVMRAVKRVNNLASTDSTYYNEIMDISNLIGGRSISITPIHNKYKAKVKSIEYHKPAAIYSNHSPYKIAK